MGSFSDVSVDQLIVDVIAREGGFVNDDHDAGGATNYGITLATLSAWRHRDVSIDDVRHLSMFEATRIYKSVFFKDSGIYLLPDRVQPIVFDMAVNSGVVQAVKILQSVVSVMGIKVVEDGVIGGLTIQSCQVACTIHGRDVITAIVSARRAFYKDLVLRHPDQVKFLRGWLRRADSFLA